MKSTVEFDLSDKTHRDAMRAALDVLDGVTSDTTVQGAAEPIQIVTPEPAKRKKATKPEAVQAVTPETAFAKLESMLGATAKPHTATPVQPVDETPLRDLADKMEEVTDAVMNVEPTVVPTVSIEDVRKAVSSITIASPEKRPELVKLLGEYGAANVTSLDPAHYGAFVERLKSI